MYQYTDMKKKTSHKRTGTMPRKALSPVAAYPNPTWENKFQPLGYTASQSVIQRERFFLYGEFFNLSTKEWITIREYIITSVKELSLFDQETIDKLQGSLDQKVKEPKVFPDDLLDVVFKELQDSKNHSNDQFVENLKNAVKLIITSQDSYVSPTPRNWSLNSSDLDYGRLTDYQIKDEKKVRKLLLYDSVSTTQSSTQEKPSPMQQSAAELLYNQKDMEPTADNMTQLLISLNNIYIADDKRDYIKGFRFKTAQIGQCENTIGTTPAIEVETEVRAVMQKIETNLKQMSETDRQQTVINTAAYAYQTLISIHPFINGNGRTCRMFSNYILMHFNMLPATFTSDDAKLSLYADHTPEDAQAAMVNALTRSAGMAFST